MDSKTGGLSSDEKQRQAAAEIARRKVLKAYETKQEVDWKKYHTAWQDYYQKYYSQYYMNAAKEYVARTQVKQLREEEEKKAEEAKVSAVIASGPTEEEEKAKERSFKARIRERATEKEKKSSRRRKLTPILMGVSVALVILFLQYNRLIFAPIAAYVSPGESPAGEITAVDPTVTLTKVSAENKLIIPKLNVDVPLNFGVDINDVMAAMNHGVVHYRINGASAYPGEIGNFVVMGHSAGDVYSSNQYKFIFSGLERLEVGDIMYVHYNSVRYTYKMVGREIILPTEVSKLVIETDKPMMTLVTCWPLGTSQKRLLISAEQISPVSEEAKQQEEVEEKPAENTEMPQNEDTLFDRIRKWIFGE